MLAVALTCAAGLVTSWLYFRFVSIEGLYDALLGVIYKEDTVYSVGYNDQAFREVQSRMTEDDVRSLLGPPVGVLKLRSGGEVWSFSRSPADTHYRFRTVRFGPDRRVLTKSAGFWVD